MSKRNIIITVSIAGAVIIFFLVYYGITSSGKKTSPSGTGSQTSDLQPEDIQSSVDIPEKPSYLSDKLIKTIIGKARWYLNNSYQTTKKKAEKYSQPVKKQAVARAAYEFRNEFPNGHSPVTQYIYNVYKQEI